MKAQQELPQESNQQSLVTSRTEGSPFQRQLDRRKTPIKKHMVGDTTANTGATLLPPGSALEHLSAEAHPDSK